jgi:ribosomal protein S17E
MEKLSLNEILVRSGKRALGGGIPGAFAGVIQVLCLMWLRTTANYQSRYGTTFTHALNTLLREGGIQRLYQGLSFALIHAPLMRFVSTAANDGVLALLASFEATRNWGPGRTTVFASIVVGMARVILMPLDTMKTVLQVDSSEGFRNLIRTIRTGKFMVLYQGSIATVVSAIAGHYPWFFTFNFLSNKNWVAKLLPSKIVRNGVVGLMASIVSDTSTNFLKVIKTTKQVLGSKHNSSYIEVIRMILAADGWKGLFGRGLRTRIGTNALQSVLFTIIWRWLAEQFRNPSNEDLNCEDDVQEGSCDK